MIYEATTSERGLHQPQGLKVHSLTLFYFSLVIFLDGFGVA
jgi:hypothetical protein